jgi:molybdenum cofactor synthesis domain-containing protein
MAPVLRAEILSIGTELTVGETRDTNAGDLARDLSRRGVVVNRITALPDERARVSEAFGAALQAADLVVSTGGLGPTPDDLTREAIAGLLGETPVVDRDLEAWLRELFGRRHLAFPEANRKQAWLIPSAAPIPNEHGTAPGWWVERGTGLIVALPGPPREMRPMWDAWVVPRLVSRGLGGGTAAVTLRTTGIGESSLADRLGALLEAGRDPTVATYARSDAVDIRVSGSGSRVREVAARLRDELGDHVWAEGETTWPEAIAAALDVHGWRIGAVEVGLRGALAGLLGERLGHRLARLEMLPLPGSAGEPDLEALADVARRAAGAEIGLAVVAHERGADLAVTTAVAEPDGVHRETHGVFLGGPIGRTRAAVTGSAVLLRRLRRRSRREQPPA